MIRPPSQPFECPPADQDDAVRGLRGDHGLQWRDDMFIMGSAFMDAMDIFAPAGIRLMPVVHEQGAAHMADGYAVSGRHGVVIGQNGPGISNCVTAIAAAYWAHTPVVIDHAGDGHGHDGPGRFPGVQPAADVPGVHQVPGAVTHPARMASIRVAF